jgi:glycosyltransferase involved in cell wall biosynthesis
VLRPASAAVLLGRVADVFGVLDRAEVVWVPGRSETGVQVALEGMAAGRPVVAARWPRLAEVVRDEETGLLATPGDLVSWARQTQRLLADPGLASRLAEAGRRFALEQCRPDELARRCAEVYRS